MNFSKLTLFAAALLSGAAVSASAATTEKGVSSGTLDFSTMSQSYMGNIIVEDDGFSIGVAAGDAYTISGSFLSPNGSLADQEALDEIVHYSWAKEMQDWDEGTVTISGGGTLEYAGTVGSGYYTKYYTLSRGDSFTNSSPIVEAWAGFDSFMSRGVFTGKLVVDENTTLNLTGQIVQYVGLFTPNSRDVVTAVNYSFLEFIGVSSVVLQDYATISFESSRLNMRDAEAYNESTFVSEDPALALNFLQNVEAKENSKIVIGTDTGSVNRIVVNTDLKGINKVTRIEENENGEDEISVEYSVLGNEISTIGRLAGNGRFFTNGDGAIAFIGQSELNPGSDTTGNTWIEGNRLADIALGNDYVYVGANPIDADERRVLKDSEVAGLAVDNVFANATAVQIGYFGHYDYSNNGVTVTCSGPDTHGGSVGFLTVYGDQVFNNFQSLWVERSALLSVPDNSVALDREPVWFSYNPGTVMYISTGVGAEVRVAGGSVLTINQAEGRDGWFGGSIITHMNEVSDDDPSSISAEKHWGTDDYGDGLVVKTGAGRIYNTGVSENGVLSRLRVEGGTWISRVDGLKSADVSLFSSGTLEIIVDSKSESTGTVSALSSGTSLAFSRFVILENDITLESLEGYATGETTDLEYRYYIAKEIDYSAAAVQVAVEQAQFYGTVVVNDGLTLILGDSEAGSNSPSIFSSASGLVLNGVNTADDRYTEYGSSHKDMLGNWLLENYDGSSLQYSTLEILSGIQLVRNLGGDSDHAAVRIEKGATLVLTSTSDSSLVYTGGFSGNGNLVNLGGSRTIRVDNTGDLFGTLTMLSGSATVVQSAANAGFSGLVLANNTSVTIDASATYSKVGALVGEAGTSVFFGGDFTVGDMSAASGRIGADGEYLATADYNSYESYFKSGVESVLKSLKDNVSLARETATAEKTLAYLANPAKLVYTETVYATGAEGKNYIDYSALKLDGAFSKVFTTTGTDRNGNSVFAKMKEGASDPNFFGNASTVAEWLKTAFSEANVADFIKDPKAQLSEQMKTDLTALAAQIANGEDGVCVYLDGADPATANLNYVGWNAIVSAGGLEFLKWYATKNDDDSKNAIDFSGMTDSSFYSFVTLFWSDYEFVLTERNAQLISTIYGMNSALWMKNGALNYEAFIKSFGVESSEFAGTLMGTGNLIKVGAETLRLTGVNSYTGATLVRAGELHVDWDAIQTTSGITVDAGALFTITANSKDEIDYDADGKPILLGTTYGKLLRSSQARLRGAGVVLKLGDGNVDLYNALLDADAESGEDFTGTFVIGEGGLKATVDAATRSANGNALAFDIVFSGAAGDARSFTLAFDTDNGKIKRASADDPAVELDFDGQITDVAKNGTLILDLGQSGIVSAGANDGWTAVLNNILNVGADKFEVSNIALNSGTLRISTNADVTFDTLTFGDAKAELIFDLTTDASLSSLSGDTVDIKAGGDEKKGALVVRANTKNESTDLYEEATLTLKNTKLGGISSLTLEGGAQLVIEGLTVDPATDIELTSLSGDEQTSLTLGENRTLELTVNAGEVAEFFGSLLGTGTFVFEGRTDEELAAGTLVIGNTTAYGTATTKTAFGGEIVLKNGTLELNAGENLTLQYTGLTISQELGASEPSRTLVKDGAGTIEILSTDAVGNSISVQNLKVDVQAGELAVSGDLFDNGGVLPTAFNIESGATFRFVDPMNNLEIESLGTLSGTGTLAFGSDVVGADAAEKVEISVDSNITNTFTGVVYIAENVTLTLGGNVTEFAGFAGDGTVFVGNSDGKLTVRVNASADGSNPFGGTIENLKDLTVVGEGALVFGSTAEIPSDLTKITVGTASENGGIGVGVSWNGGIDAVGATSRVIVSGYDSENTAFAGTTTVKDSVENLVLLRDGTLALGAGAVAEAFQLKNAAGTGALDLSDETSTLSVTLGNIAGTSLTLTNLSELDAENFELVANANPENGYALVFSGAETNGRSRAAGYALFAATDAASGDDAAAGDAVWTKDISGAGGISVADGATLTLTSGTLSYTGATYVEAGSTLVYDSESGRTVLQTSSLDVAGTLQGGVTLAADNASIVFESGATYVFTGAGVRFTGTASLAGGDNTKLNVRLTADSLDVRGTPLALFEYVGEDSAGGKNDLSWNKIEVEDNTKDGVYYYKDESVDTYESGKTVLYIATDDLANVPGVSLHDGLGAKFLGLLSAIATPDAGTLNNNNALGITLFTENADGSKTLTGAGSLADAIIKTPNGSLDAALTNLSPLGYASMLALPQSGFLSDISAVTSRLEARRYDNYAQFIWETHNDWEFFVQAQGSTLDADDATDTRTFDMDTYGAVAGADVKLGATTTAGFSVAYDYGKADFRNGGGKVESNDIRATAFVGKVFCEQFYFDAGVQGGFASYDAKRHTLGGTAKGDTTGLHAGAFFNVGTLIPLAVSEDEATSLYLMPYVGLAYSYYNVGSFSESGASTALKTDSFDANSLRASIGASLALKFRLSGMGARFNFDFSYSRELLDTDADITSAMPEIFGSTKMKFSAEAFAQDVFSVGPRISLDLDSNKSIYAGYRFDMTTDAETAHSLNIGFRSRF